MEPADPLSISDASLASLSGRSGSGASGDAFDLSSILEAVPAPTLPSSAAKANRVAFVPAFTFPGTEESAAAAGEPLDALDLLDDALPLPSGQPARVMGASATGAWRVKNERGVEYELMTLDAVVAWLEGKASYDSIRVARGAGAYLPVHDVPELAARLGIRSPVVPSGFGGASGTAADPPLRLDLDPMHSRRPKQARQVIPAPSSAPSRASAAGPGFAAAPAVATAAKFRLEETRGDLQRALGLGFTLLVAAGTCALAALVVFFTASSWTAAHSELTTGPAPAETSARPETQSTPLLADAQAAFDARRYTAAEQLLVQAAKASPENPQVQRLLALTLSRLGGRTQEARDALTRYRSLRASGGKD